MLKLKKALYGLKQAPRAWYSKIVGHFRQQGFERCPYEAAVYIRRLGEDIFIISLYVDDMIITGSSEKDIQKFKSEMMDYIEMTDLGEMNYFLGIEISQNAEGVFLSQTKYANKLLENFKMTDCKSVSTPLVPHEKNIDKQEYNPENAAEYRSMVGSLLYLTATRPDLMFAASYLSRYMRTHL